MLRASVLLALVASATAQTVRLNNSSAFDYDGWWSVVVDVPPPFPYGWVIEGPPAYYVAREGEGDEWPVDVRAFVSAGSNRDLDLHSMASVVRPVVRLADLGEQHAGQPLLNGLGVTYTVPVVDGAGVTVRGHVVLSEDCVAVLSFRWFAETPSRLTVDCFLHGTSAVPVSLSWGDGQCWAKQTGWTVVWPRLFKSPVDLQSAHASHSALLSAQQI